MKYHAFGTMIQHGRQTQGLCRYLSVDKVIFSPIYIMFLNVRAHQVIILYTILTERLLKLTRC